MTLTKYKITSPKMEGYILITYQDEELKSIVLELKQPLNPEQFMYFKTYIPRTTGHMESVKMGALTVRKLSSTPELKTNEKLAKFCDFYMRYVKDKEGNPLKYKVSAPDSGKIKQVDVNDELLQCYFSSANFLFKNKYSISNFVRYYNELRAECYQAATQRQNKFPNKYDRDFEKKLTGEQLTQYWVHLRTLGLKPVKNQMQQTVDWR